MSKTFSSTTSTGSTESTESTESTTPTTHATSATHTTSTTHSEIPTPSLVSEINPPHLSSSEEEEGYEVSKSRLFTAVICANLNSFSMGTSLSWTSPMMPRLHKYTEDSPLDAGIDEDQMAWVFSLVALGAGIAGYTAGRFQDRFGRKPALLAAAIMFAIAYILLMFSFRVELLYAGRFSQGVGSGFTMAILPIYVGEVATKRYRASAGSLIAIFMTSGGLSVIVAARFFHYAVVQIFCLIFPIMFFTLYHLIPESPYYLTMWDQEDEAFESLRRLCGKHCADENIEDKLVRIRKIVLESKRRSKNQWVSIIHHQSIRKAIVIVTGLMFFQQMSGVYVLIMNGQWIFAQANFFLSPSTCTIIVGAMQILFSIIQQSIVDKYRRRALLKCSAFLMAICHFAIGTYFYAQANSYSDDWPDIMNWIPLVFCIVFQFSYRLGFANLPFVMCGEMFPPHIKSLAVSLVTLTWWSTGFLVTYYYPLVTQVNMYLPFFMLSHFCVLAYVFTDIVVIETHNLTLYEIQKKLRRKLRIR